jgi:DNA mismatch repair protein MutS
MNMKECESTSDFKKRHHYDLLNPMMQQYVDIKETCQDSLLLFRLGDFYELFFQDAEVASSILNLVLTSRGKASEGIEIPMCGVPHHALEGYLTKLISQGFTVALCEQLESPVEAKKRGGSKALVRREIVRIFTPSTIIEESMVDTTLPNYLVALVIKDDAKQCTLCCVDVGACDISVFDIEILDVGAELEKLQPKELIISKHDVEHFSLDKVLEPFGKRLLVQDNSWFSLSKAVRVIQDFYEIASISSIGQLSKSQIQSIGVVLEYLNVTQKTRGALPMPQIINTSDFMSVDLATQRNLEIISSSAESGVSLFSVLNRTVTKSGSRLLYKYLKNPLSVVDKINARLEVTSFFYNNATLLKKVHNYLNLTGDLERSLTKISMHRFGLQDFLAIKTGIQMGSKIKETFSKLLNLDIPMLLQNILADIFDMSELHHEIHASIKRENLPLNLSEGGFICPDYHLKLSSLNALLKQNIEEQNLLRIKYAQITGVENLKIQQNNVVGLFIEVPQRQAHKVDTNLFTHKQTTTTSVRFITKELAELETNFRETKHQAVALEHEILACISEKIKAQSEKIRLLGNAFARLDLFCSFANVAGTMGYVMPILKPEGHTYIQKGRHPVIESVLRRSGDHFVANDCEFNDKKNIWLITGPNMGGKSTFMRQNALIVLMGQIGSFVPAEVAEIKVVDKLFCRIGANDALSKGQSTFMVEMCETASILAQATPRSLIVLDEVGRGTSTYDGIAIAAACVEYIAKKLQSRCLFATHYHELTQLSSVLPGVSNYTVEIKEIDEKITFLYSIVSGVADKSYGVHVARIAGLPADVLNRANSILKKLEVQHKAVNLCE